MRNIAIFIRRVCLAVVIMVLHGCVEEGIIPRKDMATIFSEMYLVDQVLEAEGDLKLQADSMLVYPAVMERNGYTIEEFHKSMAYYMNDGESLSDIYKVAKEILGKREKELNRIIKEKEHMTFRGELKVWWAIDSVRMVDSREFLYDKLLRSMRWMVLRDEMKQDWTILDSAIVDIPQNPQWWINTVALAEREFRSIIQLRSREAKEENRKLNKDNEKNSSELPVPVSRRAADKKRVSGLKQLK